MCAACGVPTHVAVLDPAESPGAGQPAKFAALRNPECRRYLGGATLAMMADNIEHVITYWVIWQPFHSPAADRLRGHQPLGAVPAASPSTSAPWPTATTAASSSRPRRRCSWRSRSPGASCSPPAPSRSGTPACCWSCTACAGALWAPAEQLLLHDFVGRADLPSAIRLNATARTLGILCGPVVGSALLLGLGPTARHLGQHRLLPAADDFLMARTRFTGHTRTGVVARERVTALAAVRVFREVSRDRVLAAMIILAGLGSFFVGSAMQTAMPSIASTTTGIVSGTAYGVLLFANGLGGVLGGLLLEGTGLDQAVRPRRAVVHRRLRRLDASSSRSATTTSRRAAARRRRHRQPRRHVHHPDRRAAARPTREERPGHRRLRGRRQRHAHRQRLHRRLPRRRCRPSPRPRWSSAALCACVAILAVYLAVAARRAPAPDVLPDAVRVQEAGTSAG